jgi:translation initiation factor IF-2
MKEQTKEALHHAKEAGVTIVVAINKCDKPGFNADNVYRELSELSLLPEAWGGQTITVNTSAVTKEGIRELLEMLALQAEVLELRANPTQRARGTVLESELHKGMGQVATILVQNGTLKKGDALVFERNWGRVRTMQDEHGKSIDEAPPSTPVEITGLSGLPKAGDPFIVVKSEKEAQSIVEAREAGLAERMLQQRKSPTLESFLLEGEGEKKLLKLIIRADVQGSMEALKASIQKIESDKANVEVIFSGVGEISESDVQLAAASNAVILGFHTRIEKNAESIIKEHKVTVKLHDIIYHAIDDVKLMMTGLLDQVAEEHERGEALVQAVFKSSHLGRIAGCLISDGLIHRNHYARVLRDGEMVWKGKISSIKREKDDVKEVKKGLECGIILDGFKDIQEGDVIQAYEIVYKSQEL